MKFSIAVLFLSFICFSAQAQWTAKAPTIKGNGTVMTEARSLETFNRLDVGGAIDVYVYPAAEHRVEITTDENILEYVKTEVSGGQLTIKTEANLKKFKQLMVVVHTPQFDELLVSGASDLWVKDNFQSPKLSIYASGASNVTVENIRSEEIFVRLSGASDMTISGTCDKLEVDAAGSSDLMAKDLQSRECKVKGSGASDLEVHATQSIKGSLSGSVDLEYAGNPKSVDVSTSGASDIEKI